MLFISCKPTSSNNSYSQNPSYNTCHLWVQCSSYLSDMNSCCLYLQMRNWIQRRHLIVVQSSSFWMRLLSRHCRRRLRLRNVICRLFCHYMAAFHELQRRWL